MSESYAADKVKVQAVDGQQKLAKTLQAPWSCLLLRIFICLARRPFLYVDMQLNHRRGIEH